MADLKISQFTDGGAIQATDEIATNRAGTNTKVFVGSAAALDAGSGIGDVVLIEDVGGSPGLPAIDGSQLLNVGAGDIKVSATDAIGGYLDDKIGVETLLTKTIVTDSAGAETIVLEVRSELTAASVASGTHTVDIADGDFHEITATGVFTFGWAMGQGQSVLVRGIDFDTYTPVDGLDWGDAGTPEWTGIDDFIVYRDADGDYIGALIVAGIT